MARVVFATVKRAENVTQRLSNPRKDVTKGMTISEGR